MKNVKEIKYQENAESLTIEIIETKSDYPIQPHNGKKIDRIIVSQYIEDDSYAVTYSKEDNSILGWFVNVEENGQQRPDVYFKFDQHDILLYKLYKKMLLFSYYDHKLRKYLF
jgi:hypothetical protein